MHLLCMCMQEISALPRRAERGAWRAPHLHGRGAEATMRSSSGTASATGPSRSLTQALEEGYAQHQLVLDRQRHSKRIEGEAAW